MDSPAARTFKRSLLIGIVSRAFGFHYYGAEHTSSGLVFLSRKPRRIALSDLAGTATTGRFLGFSLVTFPLRNGTAVAIAGLSLADAASLKTACNDALRLFVAGQFTAAEEELRLIAKAVKHLERPRRYPSAGLLEPFLTKASEVLERFPSNIPDGALSQDQLSVLDAVSAFRRAPEAAREAAIKCFLEAELEVMAGFFDTIESNPLTPEQRRAVVTDEDATLVLAGAGSGKTSVIVAKAAYLIEREVRAPDEILLLSFGKYAAAEMATRVLHGSGESVAALTFHALGYEIIRKVEETAPAPAPHASDEAQFRALLREILTDDIVTEPKLARLLLQWFSQFYHPYKSEWDFATRDEYGIDYQYEPDFEHELSENDRRAYTPDFKLTSSGVYIEHFGVRRFFGPDGSFVLTTAPFVDTEEYLEGMEWKRAIHRKYGTTLIETYSYERVEGSLTGALEEKLASFVTLQPIPADQVFEALAELGQVDGFTQTLGTFLRHFKSSGTTIERCRARGDASKDPGRSEAFLAVFEPVFEAYQGRLGKRIDFEDMILRAADHVASGRYRSPYRHILVDEFQDISAGRARLLKSLKAQHADARVFAVGDDWQSIYRFTGSDIHLMRNFGAEFGGTFAGAQAVHATVDLGRTFRSVDKIALPAMRFVLQNPNQIRKSMATVKASTDPAVKIVYYSHGHAGEALATALRGISLNTTDTAGVLLLGRYHYLEPGNLRDLASSHPNLAIDFMTVHASKGLEADHVVILGATAGKLGFPAEIVDDPLLDLVLPEPEEFEHAEERRLFYVALTRAKESVTILADQEEPSAFVRELVEDPEYETVVIGGDGAAARRCGKCGGRMIAQNSKNDRLYFACEHRRLCGHTLLPCSACGKDVPVKKPHRPGKLVCSCGAEFPACPACSDGWLVERAGPYGTFLGCVNYPECEGKAAR